MAGKLLFVSDLDGTIVDQNGQVPEEIRRFIAVLQREGGHFSIATGRGFPGVRQFQLSLTDPSIFENGGKIILPDETVVAAFPFGQNEILRLIKLLNGQLPRIAYAFFPPLKNGRYLFLIMDETKKPAIEKMYADSLEKITSDLVFFFKEFQKGAARLSVVGDIEVPPNGFNHTTNTDCHGIHYHEFNHRGSDKGTSAKKVAALLDVPLSKVMVAGNDVNDVPLFRGEFGIRITVGPACPESLLRLATHHAETMAELPLILRGLTRLLLSI